MFVALSIIAAVFLLDCGLSHLERGNSPLSRRIRASNHAAWQDKLQELKTRLRELEQNKPPIS